MNFYGYLRPGSGQNLRRFTASQGAFFPISVGRFLGRPYRAKLLDFARRKEGAFFGLINPNQPETLKGAFSSWKGQKFTFAFMRIFAFSCLASCLNYLKTHLPNAKETPRKFTFLLALIVQNTAQNSSQKIHFEHHFNGEKWPYASQVPSQTPSQIAANVAGETYTNYTLCALVP